LTLFLLFIVILLFAAALIYAIVPMYAMIFIILGALIGLIFNIYLEELRRQKMYIEEKKATLKSLRLELKRNLELLETLPRNGTPLLVLHTKTIEAMVTKGMLDLKKDLDNEIIMMYKTFITLNKLSDKITNLMLGPARALTNFNKMLKNLLSSYLIW